MEKAVFEGGMRHWELALDGGGVQGRYPCMRTCFVHSVFFIPWAIM